MTIKRNENGCVYLSYDSFEKTGIVRHGFSTRCGGVSKGHLSSMNLSLSRGDDPENVMKNYEIFGEAVGFDPGNVVFTVQTHTTNIRKVTAEDRGKGLIRELDYTDIDGLITNVPGIALTGFYADCVPLLFLDPVKKCIGVAHSGWRGTVGRIGEKMVSEMERHYGSDPADLLAVIGPSICVDCYEVSSDVANQFLESFDEIYHDRIMKPGKAEGKYQLNLWECNRIILSGAGVMEEHIEMPGICTCCNPEFLFSHRASNGLRGNLAAVLQLCN